LDRPPPVWALLGARSPRSLRWRPGNLVWVLPLAAACRSRSLFGCGGIGDGLSDSRSICRRSGPAPWLTALLPSSPAEGQSACPLPRSRAVGSVSAPIARLLFALAPSRGAITESENWTPSAFVRADWALTVGAWAIPARQCPWNRCSWVERRARRSGDVVSAFYLIRDRVLHRSVRRPTGGRPRSPWRRGPPLTFGSSPGTF